MSRPEPVLENDFTAHLGQWVVLSSPQTWNDPVLRSDWKALVNGSDNLNVVYQSPEWFDHLQSMDEIDRLKLAVARDESGRYTGIIPLMLSNHSLDFRISSHSLGTLTIRDLFFLGGHFLAPPDQDSLDKLILTLADLFPSANAFGFSPIEIGSATWNYLKNSTIIRERFLLYLVDGSRNCHTICLPATLAEYLGRFSSKKRYNLKRQVRILRDHGEGRLELRRIETSNDIAYYVETLTTLQTRSRKWLPGGNRIDHPSGRLKVYQSLPRPS